MPDNYVIRSENDFFDILQTALAEGENFSLGTLDVENWPLLKLHLDGEKFDRSITPSVMKGIIELQNSLYRAYAQAKYGTPNTARLTEDERDKLEIIVRVDEGSSVIDLLFEQPLNTFINKAVGQMTGSEILFGILGVTFLGLTYSFLKHRLSIKAEERKNEVTQQEKKDIIDGFINHAQVDTKRLEIIDNIVNKNQQTKEIGEDFSNSLLKLTKNLSKVEEAEMDNLSLSGEAISEILKSNRHHPLDVQLNGVYRIQQVDSSKRTEFKVVVKGVENNLVIVAKVQDRDLDDTNKQVLQQAEWDKIPVKLAINAKEYRDEIRSAVIIEATRLDDN